MNRDEGRACRTGTLDHFDHLILPNLQARSQVFIWVMVCFCIRQCASTSHKSRSCEQPITPKFDIGIVDYIGLDSD